MKRWTYFVVSFAVALASTQALANVLNNPGFEDPTVDMGSALDTWFRFNSGGGGNSSESTVSPRSGTRHIDLGVVGVNHFAGVFQRLGEPVAPGQTVTFSGFHKSVGLHNSTVQLQLEWQGTPNPPQNRLDILNIGQAYEPFTHTGVAPAGTTGLVITYAISSFGAGQGTSTVYIDDFDATIPEPATGGALTAAAMGLGALATRRRRN